MATRYEEDRETFSADAYKIRGYEGVAWRVLGWDIKQIYEEYTDQCWYCRGSGYDDEKDQQCERCDGTGQTWHTEEEPTDQRTGMIVARMIGDDRDFVLDAGDITPISREDYCGGCGQIGCSHDGYDHEDVQEIGIEGDIFSGGPEVLFQRNEILKNLKKNNPKD